MGHNNIISVTGGPLPAYIKESYLQLSLGFISANIEEAYDSFDVCFERLGIHLGG